MTTLILTLLLAVSFILGIARAYKGKHALEKILAFDYLSFVGIGAMAVIYSVTREPLVLDIAVCLALVGFFTAFILAGHVSKGKEK